MTSRAIAIYGMGAAGVLVAAAAFSGPLADSRLTPVIPIGLLGLGLLVVFSVTRPAGVALLGFSPWSKSSRRRSTSCSRRSSR